MGKIFKDDVGVLFNVETGIDLTGATTYELRIIKPDDTTDTWIPTIAGTVLTYTTLTSDLDQCGKWKIAAYVEFGVTSKHFGEVDFFRVHERFRA